MKTDARSTSPKRRRSVLHRPSGGTMATTTSPSLLNCFIGEAQSTRRSAAQTNLLGNNCYCLKPNCSGTVHVLEMNRVLTSPCFDFPLYSLETRRLVKCNKCFYVSTLQAHKLNSRRGDLKPLPLLKLSRAPPKDGKEGGSFEVAASTEAVRPPVGYVKGGNQQKFQCDESSFGTNNSIIQDVAAFNEKNSSSKKQDSAAGNSGIFSGNLSFLTSVFDFGASNSNDQVATQEEPSAASRHKRIEAFRQHELTQANPTSNDWWNRDETPRTQNGKTKQKSFKSELEEKPTEKPKSKLYLDEQNELVAALIRKIQEGGNTEDQAVQLANMILQLQAKGGMDTVKPIETEKQEEPVIVYHGKEEPVQPIQWLLVKQKGEGESTEVSALQSADRIDPRPITIPTHPYKVANRKPNASEDFEASIQHAPSDLIHYIARTKKAETKTRDPPQCSGEPEESPRAQLEISLQTQILQRSNVALSLLQGESPKNDPPFQNVGSSSRQDPGGAKMKDKDPWGKRRGKPSRSSRLTNPDRKRDGKKKKKHTMPENIELQFEEEFRDVDVQVEAREHIGRNDGIREAPPFYNTIHTIPKTPPDDRTQSSSPLTMTPELRVRPTRSRSESHGFTRKAFDPYEAHYPSSPIPPPTSTKATATTHTDEKNTKRRSLHRRDPIEIPPDISLHKKFASYSYSLPAVQSSGKAPLATAALPQADQMDKTIDDIINETVTVMRSSIPRAAIAMTPVEPVVLKKQNIHIRRGERRVPEAPRLKIRPEKLHYSYYVQDISLPTL